MKKLKPFEITATMTYTMHVEAEDYVEAVSMGRERLIDIPFQDWSLAEIDVDADEITPQPDKKNV